MSMSTTYGSRTTRGKAEGLGPGHVHEELCKQHQDIASTSWVQSGRFREGDTFATKRIHSLFNYLDNYVRASRKQSE